MAKEPDDRHRGDETDSDVDGSTPGFPRSTLEYNRVFESLAHVRRRYLCYLLCDRSQLQVDDAVAAIAEWESDDETPSRSHHERIKLSLLHSHIPKLRAEDVVEFDPHSETLVTDEAEAVLAALRAVGTALRTERPSEGDNEVA